MKAMGNSKFDIKFLADLQYLYGRLHSLISLGQTVVLQSLEFMQPNNLSTTTCFQVVYHQPTDRTFKSGFEADVHIFPTDLLGLGTGKDVTTVKLVDESLDGRHRQVRLVAWAYSSLLFGNTTVPGSIATPVISLNIFDSKTMQAETMSKGYLSVSFPLRLVMSDDCWSKLRCFEIEYTSHSMKHNATASDIRSVNRDPTTGSLIVQCTFAKPHFVDTFYTVAYIGDTASFKSTHTHADAMNEWTSNVRLEAYGLPAKSMLFLAAVCSTITLRLLF